MAEKRRKNTSGGFMGGIRPIHRRRILIVMMLASACFLGLILRTAWHQTVRGEDLSRAALEQQTSDNTVSAKRGKIYDRNFKVLASNVSVETVSITPKT